MSRTNIVAPDDSGVPRPDTEIEDDNSIMKDET